MSQETSQLSKRYAKALYEAALEHKNIKAVEEQLNEICKAFKNSSKIKELATPLYNDSDLFYIIDKLAKKVKLEPIIINFLKLLIKNRRLGIIENITVAFDKLSVEYKNQINVNIIAATELDQQAKEKLTETLRKNLGRDVNLNVKIDESILGGLIIRIGSKMWDNSLLGKLQKLKRVGKEAIATI